MTFYSKQEKCGNDNPVAKHLQMNVNFITHIIVEKYIMRQSLYK
jgi:hypothetical protein